jgi:hypothetical protein
VKLSERERTRVEREKNETQRSGLRKIMGECIRESEGDREKEN